MVETSVAALEAAADPQGPFLCGPELSLADLHLAPVMAYFSGTPQRPYDVTADGQRFLMIKDPSGDRAQFLPRIVVVLNWTEELKTRVR